MHLVSRQALECPLQPLSFLANEFQENFNFARLVSLFHAKNRPGNRQKTDKLQSNSTHYVV